MSIGIIGPGTIGGTLARRCVALGHHVAVANSRDPETIQSWAAASVATAAWPGSPVCGADLDADGVRRALAEATPDRSAAWRA